MNGTHDDTAAVAADDRLIESIRHGHRPVTGDRLAALLFDWRHEVTHNTPETAPTDAARASGAPPASDGRTPHSAGRTARISAHNDAVGPVTATRPDGDTNTPTTETHR